MSVWKCVRGIALALLVLAALALVAGCGASAPNGWDALGLQNNDRALTLARDPSQPQLIYIGANGGAVYRARADKNGEAVAGQGIPADAFVEALLPDARTAGLVYAGTSDGLYVSTDYGDTWRARGSGLPGGDAVDALAEGATPQTLFAGTVKHGVFVSTDQGASWRSANAGLPQSASVNALLFAPQTQTLYVALDAAGLYASGDGGASWTRRAAGLPAQANAYALAERAGGDAATLFLGTSQGVYASADGGATWAASDGGLPQGRALALATDPSQPNALYAGVERTVYRSTDGGHTWQAYSASVASAITALIVAPAARPGASPVVFVAAGALLRHPARGGTQNAGQNAALSVLAAAILIGLLIFVVVRARRQMRDLDASLRAERERGATRAPDVLDAPAGAHRPPVTGPPQEQSGVFVDFYGIGRARADVREDAATDDDAHARRNGHNGRAPSDGAHPNQYQAGDDEAGRTPDE